jgi:hypothetical protein
LGILKRNPAQPRAAVLHESIFGMQKIMAKNFRELRKKMSLESQKKSLALAQKYSEENASKSPSSPRGTIDDTRAKA